MKTKAWRAELEPYAEEIAEMVHVLAAASPEESRADLIRREWLAAWRIFAKRHHLVAYFDSYAYAMWRDAVARHMGWLRGRIGRAHDEHVRQRRLEAAGQQRLFDGGAP